ncbi:277_t:CDS:2 [Paraglomus occultum]|uniref:277_t:CDS:1 n=1 Tax=Paraglomus occultum TaxID=144539 RepID=A0A9N9B7D5_9GLOM|nr:277_t:CDS:2 [Paraglomus occultum]
MAFHRPRPPNRTTHRLATDRELELEQINQILRDELSTEISHNKANEKWISRLERDLINCEKEINRKEIAIVASNEEIKELQTEISSLKKDLYQTRKEIRDNNNYTTDIENKLQECYEIISSLKQRIKVISSRGNSPVRNNSPDIYSPPEDPDMANLDLFIQIERGLNRIKNHIQGGGTPLNNPINIIEGIRGSLNTVRHNYQSVYQDIDGVIAQRDDRNNQVLQLQQDVNFYRQRNTNLQNQTNQLTQERDTLQNRVNQLIPERDTLQNHVNQLILERNTLQNRVNQLAQDLNNSQQGYNLRGRLWHNASLIWNEQSKLKRTLEIIYKVSIYRLMRELQQCRADKGLLEYNRDQLFDRYYNKFKDRKASHIKWKNREQGRRLPVLKLIQPALASISPYIGQEPPDDYFDKVIQSWAFAEGHMTVLENAHAGDFDDAVKCTILKSKMAGKYAPVPANDPYTIGNPAINSPATLRVWARTKYQRETVGTKQSAIQRLTQERFQPFDTPDTYETRIRPLLLGVPNDDAQVLGFLKSQLPERTPNLYGGSNYDQVSASFSANISPIISHPETSSRQLQNKSHSNSSDITRAEIDSMIKSQLALVPTTSLQPTQSISQRQEGQLLRPSQMEPVKE